MSEFAFAIPAAGAILNQEFTPRLSARDLFTKRQATCPSSQYPVLCSDTFGQTCCPSGYRCINDGQNCLIDTDSGLSKGAKIGIGVGVAVAFLIVIGIGLGIFFYCCRKASKIVANAAASHHDGHAFNPNTNPGGGYGQNQQYQQYNPNPGSYPMQDTSTMNTNNNYQQGGIQQQYTGYTDTTQGTYPQGNYPQGNYPQGNYPQANYATPGMSPLPPNPTVSPFQPAMGQSAAPYNTNTTPAPPYSGPTSASPPPQPGPPAPYTYNPPQNSWNAPSGYSAVPTDPNTVRHEVPAAKV